MPGHGPLAEIKKRYIFLIKGKAANRLRAQKRTRRDSVGAISTLDVQTRLDVHELLSRYCHLIDHGAGAAFSDLFTSDAVVEVGDEMRLVGRAEIATVPDMVQQRGGGAWRHQATNVIIDRGDHPRHLRVGAYLLVIDWSNGGALAGFSEYRLDLRKTCHWQIAGLFASTCPQGAGAVLAGAPAGVVANVAGLSGPFRAENRFH